MENLKLVDFGEAIKALKQGKRVSKKGWNGKFIFRQLPSKVTIDIVPKMQSLPESVKDEFNKRFEEATELVGDVSIHNHSRVKYRNQLAMVYPDNAIYGWVASPSDVLEEDWIILD